MHVDEVLDRDEADAVGEALDAQRAAAMRAEMAREVTRVRAAALLGRRAGGGFLAGVVRAYEKHDARRQGR